MTPNPEQLISEESGCSNCGHDLDSHTAVYACVGGGMTCGCRSFVARKNAPEKYYGPSLIEKEGAYCTDCDQRTADCKCPERQADGSWHAPEKTAQEKVIYKIGIPEAGVTVHLLDGYKGRFQFEHKTPRNTSKLPPLQSPMWEDELKKLPREHCYECEGAFDEDALKAFISRTVKEAYERNNTLVELIKQSAANSLIPDDILGGQIRKILFNLIEPNE